MSSYTWNIFSLKKYIFQTTGSFKTKMVKNKRSDQSSSSLSINLLMIHEYMRQMGK